MNIEHMDFKPDKILYLEIDDEITHVFDKLKRVRAKRIALVIPRRATVLQSVINLKILKKKIDELEKEVLIITPDPSGIQLAEKAGIHAIEKLFSAEINEKQVQSLPPRIIQKPIRFKEEKLSIAEVIRKDTPTLLGKITGRVKEWIKKRKNQTEHSRLVLVTPNKQALFTLILVSVLLLLAIAYIALPGATVYITPRSSVLETSFNISFLDYEKNKDILDSQLGNLITMPTFPVKPPEFTKKISHKATGKIFKGTNAKGTLTIINTMNNPWDLVARTRFQTENDNLIFRIYNNVRVPAAKGSVPGTLEATVIADEFDINGQAVGERGNIPPSKFFLPGIKNEENKKKLYAESKSPMTGGVTQTTKTVTKEDIASAIEQAKNEISKIAKEDLKKYLEEQNLIKKTSLSLLADNHAIKTKEPRIEVPANIIGQELEQFEITAAYSATGMAFDRQVLVEKLKDRLINRVDPDKKIMTINDDDIGYRFLDADESAGKLRLTATIKAIQIYELDPEQENGRRFLKKITDHIVGMRVKEATDYLMQQSDKISKVEISLWPVWAPTIPNIADNIKFVVQQE